MKTFKKLVSFVCSALIGIGTALPVSADNSTDSTARMLDSMTTKQKIEQMIMITLRSWDSGSGESTPVTFLGDDFRAMLEKHNFGGICIFAPNIESINQTVRLTDDIQRSALKSETGIPMLISTDQEGGNIYRLTTGTPTCGNMALGAAADTALTESTAMIIGSELSALGINTDFGPVVDVNNNPSNPIINVRSFSSDPEIVSEHGLKYIDGLHSEGIIATCKHFPGHGDTAVDSHTGLPLIDKSYDELKELELVPYQSVLSCADMVMTAHIQFPQIEKNTYTSISTGKQINLPATLSKTVITDILRGDLGFDGVVSTDALVMDAVSANFDPVDAAALAINADVDILLEPMTIQSTDDIIKIENYINDIAELVDNGTIPSQTVDKSVKRILKLKKDMGLFDYSPPDAQAALDTVGSSEHREQALQGAMKAVTVLKNDGSLLPFDLSGGGKAAYFYPFENVENTMAFALERLKKDGKAADSASADCFCYQGHSAYEYEDTIRNCDIVIAAVEMYSLSDLDKTNTGRGWQAAFVDDLIGLAHTNGKKVVFISANIPYDTARFTDADAILAAYCANGMEDLPADGKENKAYGVNYPAALLTVFGDNSPAGRLPVDIYEIDDNTEYTDNVLFAKGFGLAFDESKPPESDPAQTSEIPETPASHNSSEAAQDIPVTSADDTSLNPELKGSDNKHDPDKSFPIILGAGVLAAVAAAVIIVFKKKK